MNILEPGKWIFKFVILPCMVAAPLDTVWAACGNGNLGGPEGTQTDEHNYQPLTKDPINTYTGDEMREICDLQVWGSVGEQPMTFTRYAHTRFSSSNQKPFGIGHNWRHNYLWQLVYEGVNAKVQNVFRVNYPNGDSIEFTQINSTQFVAPVGTADMLSLSAVTGDFYLQRQNGWVYHFHNTGDAIYGNFLMTDFTDSLGNTTTLTYDSSSKLVKVTEPAGRSLTIKYVSDNLVSTYAYPWITEVDCSDGQKVLYNYQPDGAQVDLTSVQYDDGTQALYTYAHIWQYTAPLITSFQDPRYVSGPMARSRNQYVQNPYRNYFGQVQSQLSFDTSDTVVTIGEDNGQVHGPTATYGWGGTDTYEMNYPTGLLTSHTDALHRTTTYTYDSNGFQNSVTDPLKRVIRTLNSAYGNPLQMTLPDGSTRIWTRDSHDLPLTYQDELGRITTFTRDSLHRVTQIAYPDGSTEGFVYNGFGQVVSHSLRNGGTETAAYDSRGLKTSSTDAEGDLTTYTYDSFDRLATVTDPDGHTTSYQYTPRGLVSQITYADGSSRSYTYDTYGNKTSETNEIGQTTSYTYDQYQRLTSVTDPLGRTTQSVYRSNDYMNFPSKIILPSGKTTLFTYDLVWNKLSQTVGYGTADAATTSWSYDACNRPVKMTDPLGRVTTMAYDVRDRKVSQKDPLGRVSQWSYDAVGNTLAITRPDGGVTSNTFDSMNQLLTTTDPKGETTTNAYDTASRLVSVTDARGNAYRYGYDFLNRKTAFSYPDSSFEGWSYDPAGNLSLYQARNGQTESFTYDVRNRQLTGDWSDSTLGVTSTYDAASRVLTRSDSASTLRYTYDAANEELSESQAISGLRFPKSVSYTYDADGNRASLTYPDGIAIGYTYTSRNQLASVKTHVTYTYDLAGNRVNKSLADGTTATYTYDADNELLTLTNQLGNSILANYSYSYNMVGDRLSRQETLPAGSTNQSYSYDPIDQVTAVNYGSKTQAFDYDAVGNRVTSSDSLLGSTAYTANGENEYSAVGGAVYSYDGNGNLTNNGTATYQYDSKNRLLKAASASDSETILYDAANRPVTRTINGTRTYYIYDGWNLIAEYASSGAQAEQYINGGQTDEILVRTGSSGNVHYQYDGLGSTVALTDAIGKVVERYAYDVFGRVTFVDPSGAILTASAFGNRFLFTGREYLAELNLYDYRNRVYLADLGRFLQTDPVRFEAGDVNIYRYCGNNSITRADSFGLYDYNESETRQQFLDPAFKSATVGPINGLLNIRDNSQGAGPYDFGAANNPHKDDTFNVNGRSMNADQFGNYIAGFQGAAYDAKVTSPFPALLTVMGFGILYHVTGETKAINDPLDLTGLPDVLAGGLGVGPFLLGPNYFCPRK